MPRRPGLARCCAVELFGTFLLVFFGTGAVFVSVCTTALPGLLQVGIVWGVVIALATCACSATSGAHVNPAVTLACCVFRGFPARRLPPYIASQFAGAFLASALLYALFCGILTGYEQHNGLVRGQPGSEMSAMVFGEYFPNPAIFGTSPEAWSAVSTAQAMAAEAIGAALIVFFVFALTDLRNSARPTGAATAALIGLSVTILICVLAPITQAGFNPARDFGPRIFAWIAGWGRIAIPGPRGGFFSVYILAPCLGGTIGGLAYDRIVRPGMSPAAAPQPEYKDTTACDSLA